MDRLDSRHPLVRCCRPGADGAWRELLDRFGDSLENGVQRGVARGWPKNHRPEAEDLLQDVLCHLVQQARRGRLRPRSLADPAVGFYLFRVAERVVLDRARAWKTGKRAWPWSRSAEGLGPAPGLDTLAAREPSPEQRLVTSERRRMLARRLCEGCDHPTGRRNLRVFGWAYLEGMTSREISVRLGELDPSSVDSMLHRMRRRLLDGGLSVPRRTAAHGPS